jgi:hypothetical protein
MPTLSRLKACEFALRKLGGTASTAGVAPWEPMGSSDLLAQLVRDLELAGEGDGDALLARWFDLGLAVTGLSAPSLPDPLRTVEGAGSPEAALSMRAAQLQALWLIITGAKAEYAQAQASGDHDAEGRLLRALGMLVAVSEEETAAVNAALKVQTN